jgi:PAS domain S-box-containing protein
MSPHTRDLEQFRVVVDASPMAMVMVDGAGRIAMLNTAAEELFEYAHGELNGQSIEKLIPQRFRNGHPRLRADFMSAPAARSMGAGRDLFGLRKNSAEIPIEIGLNPIQTTEGFFVLAAIIDISERKRAEDLQRAVVEAAPNAIVMVGDDGKIALINAQAELLFGYARRELIGEPVEKLVPERYRSGHSAHRAGFMAEPSSRAMGAGRELHGLRRDGSEVPIEIGLSPVNTPERSYVLTSIIDITERQRTNELQRLMVEASPNAMVMVDGAGRIALLNEEAERLFGYSRRELIGEPVEKLLPERIRRGHPGMRAGFMSSPSTRSMGAGRDLFGLRADGTEIPIEIGLNPIKTSEGFFVLAAIIDITERKRTEELRLANAGMLQHNEQLESLNKELESFSYTVSHDLRAPVRAISGFAQAIAEDYGTQLDDEGRRLLLVVRSEAHRMGELIDDLLEFSRLGRTSIQPAMVDMAAIVEDLVHGGASEEINDTVSFNIGHLPPAYGDRVLLRQVWDNLISNAIKYSGKRADPIIRVTSRPAANENVYCVEDNGAGFDMQYADKLFAVFQRLHHSNEFPGSGVGLAIVHRIVTRLGGRVWAEGSVGTGARFFFSLPTEARA